MADADQGFALGEVADVEGLVGAGVFVVERMDAPCLEFGVGSHGRVGIGEGGWCGFGAGSVRRTISQESAGGNLHASRGVNSWRLAAGQNQISLSLPDSSSLA